MKENVLDVLLYLFQNFMDADLDIEPDREFLVDQLVEAGFHDYEIDKAFVWLDDLATNQENQQNNLKGTTFRLFTDSELDKLDLESRGFLLYLENMGVLTTETRELVIERVMALDSLEMDIERVKWVILMVLFNQPGQEHAHVLLEDIVFDEMEGHLN